MGHPAAALALMASLSACATVRMPPPDRFDSVTVTVTAAGLQPADVVRVRRFGTVVFRNGGAAPMQVTVVRPLGASRTCSTMLGFAAGGETSVADVAAPGFASLCFHEVGSFPFVVRLQGQELRGTVDVQEAP